MSKTIKIIELLNKIANGEELPKKVKLGNIIWNYDEKEKTYFMNNTEIELFYIEKITKKINEEVEIIEEQPELDIQEIEEMSEQSEFGKGTAVRINELIRAVKQLDNKMKGE